MPALEKATRKSLASCYTGLPWLCYGHVFKTNILKAGPAV